MNQNTLACGLLLTALKWKLFSSDQSCFWLTNFGFIVVLVSQFSHFKVLK